ncbi:type ISP restriction/modification enzyme [Corynebacterium mastitidis]|uniref:site-specific DNA-methyltransferase (adenine-specific) n=1 Tax=Corynebacterium mastitidis TaxID=161890 RepID=A0ABU8P0P1_9CORY
MVDQPVRIFISYKKHDDPNLGDRVGRDFVDEVADHIRGRYERRHADLGFALDTWYDRALEAGADWDVNIQKRLEGADLFLLVYSPGFFADEGYIATKELPMVLRRIKDEAAERKKGSPGTVFTVVRAGGVDTPQRFATLNRIQSFHEGQPVGELYGDERGEVLDRLADTILDAAARVHGKRHTTRTRTPLENFLTEMEDLEKERSVGSKNNPEDQLKAPVIELLDEVAHVVGAKIGRPRTEERQVEGDWVRNVRLDISVAKTTGAVIGHVELKSPDKGARPARISGSNDPQGQAGWTRHDKEQWKKLKEHPNLLYCNGYQWSLYREGLLAGHVDLSGHVRVSDSTIAEFNALIAQFLGWTPTAPRTPRALAQRLAPITRLLRDAVAEEMMHNSSSTRLQAIHQFWLKELNPSLDEKSFADSFAQTFTYALLLARMERGSLGKNTAEDLSQHGHRLLGSVLKILDQEAVRESVGGPIDLLETVIAAVDPKILSEDEDPWLYFYEDFLAEYDPKQRKDAGVYYTPIEVVRFQVRMVEHFLNTRFGSGFAQDDVSVLDPALGTGTYLLTIIDEVMARQREEKATDAQQAQVAQSLLGRLHGFELLVGAYAVAQLRVTQALTSAGAKMGDAGPQVLLTNTLDAPTGTKRDALQGMLFDSAAALSEEGQRAEHVKSRNTEIRVIIGNPPYDRGTREKSTGGKNTNMVLNSTEANDVALLEDFTGYLTEKGLGVHAKNLYNSYVYFWRWAMWKACEPEMIKGKAKNSPAGIVSFITSSSFLRGPGFAGMRKHMREIFDEVWMVDLHGDNRGAITDENVFNIQTPVCIVTGVQRPNNPTGKRRSAADRRKAQAKVFYRSLRGERKSKLQALEQMALPDGQATGWEQVDSRGQWDGRFIPGGAGEFYSWPQINECFPWVRSGSKFSRTWPIAPGPQTLETRWNVLVRAKGEQQADLLRVSPDRTPDWNGRGIDGSYYLGESEEKYLGALSSGEAPCPPPVRYGYRSFDRMWCLPDQRVGDRLAPSLWLNHGGEQMYLATLTSTSLGPGPAVTVAAEVPDLHFFRGSFGAKSVMPLWRNAAATEPNLSSSLIQAFEKAGITAGPEEVFAYVVGLLGTAAYYPRFQEELQESPARVPLTKDPELFAEVVQFGRELVYWSTYGERFARLNEYGVPQGPKITGTARLIEATPTEEENYPTGYEYDRETRTLRVGSPEGGYGVFEGVRPEVYEFKVSGMQVVTSWLGYRMKSRSGKKSSPLDDIHGQWAFDGELLEMLAVVEHVVDAEPRGAELLDRVLAGPVFTAKEIGEPTKAERSDPPATRERTLDYES